MLIGGFSNRTSDRTGTSVKTARAAKIPRRIWVENAVVLWPRCDLARYTTPSCLCLQTDHDVQVFHEMGFIQNSQATANKAEYRMKGK